MERIAYYIEIQTYQERKGTLMTLHETLMRSNVFIPVYKHYFGDENGNQRRYIKFYTTMSK